MVDFGKRLKELRKKNNMTQVQLAEKLMITDKAISKWERGKCFPKDTKTLIKLAEILDVSIDDLFKEHSIAYENYAQRLASVFEATHDPEDFIRADSEFKKLMKNDSLTPLDMWSYGIIHYFMMNYSIEKSLYWFDKVLEQGETADAFVYWKTRIQKMKLLSQLGKDKENILQQQKCIESNPDDVNEHCLLLAAYMFAGCYEEAHKEFQKAVAKFPDKWELYIHGGDICKKLKKYDEAFKYWDKAEELGTTFMDGKYAKASCYEDLGEYAKAYKAWSELAEILLSKGYDVEAEMPKNQAKLCLKKLL